MATDEATPQSVGEALAAARRHARLAAAEAFAALRALLDGAALLATGRAGDGVRGLAVLRRRLDDLEEALRSGAPAGAEALVEALAGALDAEIARWEARSSEDPDARAVLRAFLGLRELLWEMGVRPAPRDAADGGGAEPVPDTAAPRDPRRARASAKPRVERIRVEG
jgi:hypothetical protein